MFVTKDRDLGESNELKKLKGKNRVRIFTNNNETSSPETNENENSNSLLRGFPATAILRTRSKVKGY